MIVVGVVTVIGAGLAALFSLFLYSFGCEFDSTCDTPGLVQLLIALGGVPPALATLVESARRRGRPWRWFLLTAWVYALWGVFLAALTG